MNAAGPSSGERLRSGWLVAIGTAGLMIVGLAILLDFWEERPTIVPAVVLNLGTGITLFAVLFFAERRLVIRETTRLVQALTGDQAVVTEFANRDPEELVDPGAADVAFEWMGAMIDGRYEDAWRHSHPAWQLARSQAWLWNNREVFGDDPGQLDALAQSLLEDQSTELWASFCAVEAAQFRDAWGDLAGDSLGVASNKRRVGPGFEILVVAPLGDYADGFMVHGPVALERAFPLLMCESAPSLRVGMCLCRSAGCR